MGQQIAPTKLRAIEVLRRLYVDEEISATRIACEMGMSTVTIYKWLASAGVKRRKAGGHLTHADQRPFTVSQSDRDIVAAAKPGAASWEPIDSRFRGWPMWKIGRELGCSRDHIRCRINVAGWITPDAPDVGLHLLRPVGRAGIERIKQGLDL